MRVFEDCVQYFNRGFDKLYELEEELEPEFWLPDLDELSDDGFCAYRMRNGL